MTHPTELLHAAWQTSSGQTIHIRAIERLLLSLHQTGVTPEDITCVVNHLLRSNKKNTYQFRIVAHKVLEEEFFWSTLSFARASERNRRPAPTPKDQAISMLRPVVDKEESSLNSLSPGRHISDVFKKLGNQ